LIDQFIAILSDTSHQHRRFRFSELAAVEAARASCTCHTDVAADC